MELGVLLLGRIGLLDETCLPVRLLFELGVTFVAPGEVKGGADMISDSSPAPANLSLLALAVLESGVLDDL